MTQQFHASIWREGEWYVAQCLEIDIASQGETEEEALANIKEAVELFFEDASPEEIERRLHQPITISPIEVAVG